MLDADLVKKRAEYLFRLAYLCHVPPHVVDRMKISDFFNLVSGIDDYEREQKRQQDEIDRQSRSM